MRTRWIIGPAVALVLGGAVPVALVAPAAAVRPGDAVALLDAPLDRSAPELAYIENFDLDPESVRFAGSTESQRFWVGIARNGKVCLIAVAGTPETGGAVCAPAGSVRDNGAMMGLTPDRASGLSEFLVYLLPDRADADDVADPWVAVGGNIVVADAAATRDAPIVTVPTDDGSSISLTP